MPVLLLCEHAGRSIPRSLKDLQLGEDVLISLRAWDIGAEDVARGLSANLNANLNANLIVQRYSRLVIDANRPQSGKESIPEISDGVPIPGNLNLSDAARHARIDEIFLPMDREIELALTPAVRACFAIHAFTPGMDGIDRPWHAGFLTRTSKHTGVTLMQSVKHQQPELNLTLNQPYQIDDETDWFIPYHAEKRGLPHCLIEIRNDQIERPEGAALWAGLLAQAISEFMEALE